MRFLLLQKASCQGYNFLPSLQSIIPLPAILGKDVELPEPVSRSGNVRKSGSLMIGFACTMAAAESD
ncbi:hypothetical protein DXA36_30905 [Eisenbergiella sp. OF01-20]|nr:hypothetical protein DXA36_30905 [Eisenbergiella sp. OF01-20]